MCCCDTGIILTSYEPLLITALCDALQLPYHDKAACVLVYKMLEPLSSMFPLTPTVHSHDKSTYRVSVFHKSVKLGLVHGPPATVGRGGGYCRHTHTASHTRQCLFRCAREAHHPTISALSITVDALIHYKLEWISMHYTVTSMHRRRHCALSTGCR